MPSRFTRNEEGVAASALLVTALLVGLGIFVYMAVPYTSAVDAKAKNRSAADAAAIAGAQGAFADLLSTITGGPLSGDLIPGSWSAVPDCAGLGYSAATEYAYYNDAAVTAYRFDCTTGEAHVAVEGRGYEGQPARSTAVAQVDLPSCDPVPEPPAPELPEEPEETAGTEQPGPGPEPEPEPEPEPAEDLDLSVGCTGFDLHLQFRDTNDDGVYDAFHVPPGQLKDIATLVEARLVD